ncbi:plasmid segregation protein ParM [Thermanaeromonas toyohensis ToBE]|uniref:Plasmid segregation protein ParM n=1 Tax=Thermanaeromonas toyohensis ToBE TaxID=698762 RepID=A0A1W1VR14_9FIRM|nr:ParM/StbA family protein [Thermanaeromonas toyohensis]SMB95787.1 plasmid segregation protein ParM [Thermanaeromonas toyohensis ToBE]
MLVAIDQGYGYTKAVAGEKKAVFPSVVSPASETDLGLGRVSWGHCVTVRPQGSMVKRQYFAGELAVRCGLAAHLTLARDKLSRDISVLLMLTAAYLAGTEGQVTLAYGLPIAYFRHQRDEARRSLQGTAAYVSVDNGPEKYISFNHVAVFPQGVGALFSVDRLPQEGLVGLLDIGFYTTDYLLVDVRKDRVEPLPNYFGSMEIGVSSAMKAFGDRFLRLTGRPLSLVETQELWGKSRLTFEGQKLDLEPLQEESRVVVAQAIVEGITAAWAQKLSYVDVIYLAGGGGLEFLSTLRQSLRRDVVLVPEPQYANALGFYRMALKHLGAGSKSAGSM